MDMHAHQLEEHERYRAFRELMRANVEQTMADYMERAKPVTSTEVRSHLWTVAVADRTLRQLYDLPRQRRARVAGESEPRPEPRPEPKPRPAPKPRAPTPETDMLRELEAIARLLDKSNDTPDVEEPNADAREVAPEETLSLPVPAPAPLETHEDILAEAQNAANEELDAKTQRFAEWTGIWRDGSRVKASDFTSDAWRSHINAATVAFPPEASADACTTLIDAELLRRANALARGHGEHTGYSINCQPWRAGDPDHFVVSANRGKGLKQKADGEISAHGGLPWWIVHVPRPSEPPD